MDSSTAEHLDICWGERRVTAELTRTSRRALRIDVRPTGEVVVFAPVGEELDEIRTRAHRKGSWIFAQIDTIAQRPKATPERRYISGETHLLLGRQYRLSVERSDDPQVRIDGGRMVIAARAPDNQPHCRRLVQAFYRLKAREVLRQRFNVLSELFMRRGLRRPHLIIRPMAKRWGSFTPKGRVILNTDLVRASPLLIDYVICHELAHGFFPDHGEDWRSMMEAFMPDWETRKEALEVALR